MALKPLYPQTIYAQAIADPSHVALEKIDIVERVVYEARGLVAVQERAHPSGQIALRGHLTVGLAKPPLDELTDALLGHLTPLGKATPSAQVPKLREEVQEVADAVREAVDESSDERVLEELADVIVVCHTLAATMGFTAAELLRTVEAKMRRNAKRVWGLSEDGSTARHTNAES